MLFLKTEGLTFKCSTSPNKKCSPRSGHFLNYFSITYIKKKVHLGVGFLFRLAYAKISGKKPHPHGVFTAFPCRVFYFVSLRINRLFVTLPSTRSPSFGKFDLPTPVYIMWNILIFCYYSPLKILFNRKLKYFSKQFYNIFEMNFWYLLGKRRKYTISLCFVQNHDNTMTQLIKV